jgi:hypothetical protein
MQTFLEIKKPHPDRYFWVKKEEIYGQKRMCGSCKLTDFMD